MHLKAAAKVFHIGGSMRAVAFALTLSVNESGLILGAEPIR